MSTRYRDRTLYHGTSVVLHPGDEILPGSVVGRRVEDFGDATHDDVWLTTSPRDALHWAEVATGVYGGRPHVYEVRDVEDLSSGERHSEGESRFYHHTASSAVVMREITEFPRERSQKDEVQHCDCGEMVLDRHYSACPRCGKPYEASQF